MTNTMVTVIAATSAWKICSPRPGKSKITLSRTHSAAAVSTPTAVSGRPAQRSTSHSSRLRLDRPSPVTGAGYPGGPTRISSVLLISGFARQGRRRLPRRRAGEGKPAPVLVDPEGASVGAPAHGPGRADQRHGAGAETRA